jgi:hypothetical protein
LTTRVGVSAFISDDFLQYIKTPPFFWVYPELIKRIVSGKSPLLSDKQTRDANANGGLNLFVWEGALRGDYENRAEKLTSVLSAFLEQHRGFRLKELISHGNSIERVRGMLRTGSQFLNEDGKYVDQLRKPLHEVFQLPHYVGLTREAAMSRLGSWVGVLFLT